MNILSKLTSNEYNNKLEEILETKAYSTEVKNLLLSMLYKIENGYEDYIKVKADAEEKNIYIEKILDIIRKECDEIKIVTPQTVRSRPLEDENAICITDEERGSILVYANELDLLYSLFEMDYKCKNKYWKQIEVNPIIDSVQSFYRIANGIDQSEIIRDFDGWSWNNNLKKQENININFVYQIILLLLGREETNKILNIPDEIEKNFNGNDEFRKSIYTLILIIMAKKDNYLRTYLEKSKDEKEETQKLINNREQFIVYLTNEKKRLNNEIKKIDEILNDKDRLRYEYNTRNEKLPNKEKIFSISHLSERLEQEREVKLEEIKQKNKMLEPSEFIRLKEQNEEEIQTLQTIIESIDNQEKEKETVLKAQTIFLNNFLKEAEMANKEKLLELIYKFRYYCLIPVTTDRVIKDIPELQKQLKDVTNCLIDNGIDKEIIVNFSDSTSVCYNILKYVFVSKIINLQEIEIVINKADNKKQENDLDSKIKVSIYDLKDKEKTYEEIVKHLKLVKVKFNRKIKVFL